MKNVECTMEELYDAVSELRHISSDGGYHLNKNDVIFFNENNEPIDLLFIKKDKMLTQKTYFDDGEELYSSRDHIIRIKDKQCELVENLEIGQEIQKINGTSKVIKKEFCGLDDIFEVEVNSDGLYSTSNGYVHHNCGKTEFVFALAKLMGVEQVVRVNFHIGVTEQHLIGKTLAKDGETYFSYGIVPTLMQNGGWLILDELDYAQPEHNAVLQPILEGQPLFIPQAGNVTIHPHPNFRIFATANTKGRGDESQAYAGTNYQNASLLDRFSKFEFSYSKDEPKIVNSILEDKTLSRQIMEFFTILRQNVEKGNIANAVFTTRKLQQIAELIKFGESLMESIRYEIVDSFNQYEKPEILEIMKDIWDQAHYADWHLGDAHFVKEQTSGSTIVEENLPGDEPSDVEK